MPDPRQIMEYRTRSVFSTYIDALRRRVAKLALSSVDKSDIFEHFLISRNPEEFQEYDEAIKEAMAFLTRIPANPSKQQQSALIRDSYVFVGEGSNYVNSSELTAARFFANVVARAKLHAFKSTHNFGSKGNGKFIILKGDRGTGKTFFQNYLFSRFNELLGQVRCIAIRITLTKQKGFDENIEGWFYLQAAKVILRYYDPKSARFNASNFPVDGFSYLEENTEDTEKPDLYAMRDSFMGKSGSRKLSLLSQTLAKRLYDYCEEQGIAFIGLIDGFDRLGRDQEATERFKKLRQSVKSFLQPDTPISACFVIAMRNTTYSGFYMRNQAIGPIQSIETHEVGAPSIHSVLEKRLQALERHAAAGILHGVDEGTSSRISSLIKKFRERVSQKTMFAQVTEILANTAPNLRLAMQTVAAVFFNFATTELPNSYKLIEQLLRGRRVFPPLTHRFISGPDAIRFELSEDLSFTSYDGLFAPLVFRAPHLKRQLAPSLVSSAKELVHVTRVVWLLAERRDQMFATDFSTALEESYGYDPKMTTAILDMLESFNCVQSTEFIDNDTDEEDDYSRQVRCTAHGMALIRQYVKDPAFLNLSATRVEVDPRIFRMGLVRLSLLSANDQFRKVPHGLRSWVQGKLVNTAFLISLVLESLELSPPESSSAAWIQNSERTLVAQMSRLYASLPDIAVQILSSPGITQREINDFVEDLENTSSRLENE